MGLPSNVMFILKDRDVLLTTIFLVFLIFIPMSYGFPASLHAPKGVCKVFEQNHKRAVLSAYLKLLMLMPSIATPFESTSLNIFSVYKLKRVCDSTQLRRTPFLYELLLFDPNII